MKRKFLPALIRISTIVGTLATIRVCLSILFGVETIDDVGTLLVSEAKFAVVVWILLVILYLTSRSMLDIFERRRISAKASSLGANEQPSLLQPSYRDWLIQGVHHSKWCATAGIIATGASSIVAYDFLKYDKGTFMIFATCSVVGAVGVLIAWDGFRRERNWRQSHPFGRPKKD